MDDTQIPTKTFIVTEPRHRIHLLLLVAGLAIINPACDNSKPLGKNNGKETSGRSPEQSTLTPHGLIPLPDYAGTIEHIVFHSADGLVGRAWRPVYDLLTAMSSKTRYTFVCESEAALAETRGRLRQWKFTDRESIRTVPVSVPLSIWARDRYIAMRPVSGSALPIWLVPAVVDNFDSKRRNREREVPRLLNGFEPLCRIAKTPLVLEGGNVIASTDHILIGANVLSENAPTWTPERTRLELDAIFKGSVVLVADESGMPPIAHVDLFITWIAGDHLLVASPALGREVMDGADAASGEALRQRLFITPDMPDPKGPDFRPDRAARFDQVAARLKKRGFRVTRIPYADSRNGDFVVTYNNVIQEQRDGRHIVYMPIYQIPAMDAAATRVYESLGMIVMPIDVSPICHLLGAVRCLANVVERASP
ncbi:MAG: agmatine deiminase family protein [Phycisphaerae bacterium]